MQRHLTIAAVCLAQAGLVLAEEPAHAPEHDRGFHHRHHVALFTGGNVEQSRKGFTIGGDYAVRLHRYIGIGVAGEWVGGDFNELVWGFPVIGHPTKNWKILAGPGFLYELGEHGHNEEHSRSTASSEPGGKTSFLVRLGVGCDFWVKKLSITPSVAVDFVAREQVLVSGIAIGKGF